jgi:hypothetical protein
MLDIRLNTDGLEMMQTTMVTYRLILAGWQVAHQIGDGYDI